MCVADSGIGVWRTAACRSRWSGVQCLWSSGSAVSDEIMWLSREGGELDEAGMACQDHPGPARTVREVEDLLTGMPCDARRGLEQAVPHALWLPPPGGLVGVAE